MDKQLEGKCDPLEIVSAHYEGEQWVSGLETSTHTYFCEGFGAHNSVAEHSVVLSDWCRRRYGAEIGLWALLHDASEAYLVDVPRPIKPHLKGYSWIEAGVMDAICERFEMDPGMPPEVHEADGRIIADERENMAPCTVEWAPTGEPLGVAFSYWSPAWAEAHFMMAFNALMHEREAEERRVA